MKIAKKIVCATLALVMVLGFGSAAFAAGASFSAPKSPLVIDENVITMAAHSQGWITPEVLGINNTTARDQEVPEYYGNEKATLEFGTKSMALGVFGSDINSAPNPYMYNYFYNLYARENGLEEVPLGQFMLSKDVNGGPMNAAANGGYEQNGQVVPASLYLRPDILLGVGPVKDKITGYTAALSVLPENADEDKTNDYEPYQVAYTTTHVYSFLESMYELSDICNEITAKTGKVTRYGDPLVITENVEKFVKGIQAYVIGKIKVDGTELKTVAVLDAAATQFLRTNGVIADNEYVLNTKNMSTQATTSFSRVAEFVADTSVNLVDKLGLEEQPAAAVAAATRQAPAKESTYFKATADQIAENCDVVVFCNVLSSIPENNGQGLSEGSFQMDLVEKVSAENKDKARDMEVLGAAFSCVGSLGANSVENLLGMAYYTAYLYPEYVNQFDVIAYWMQNFYHVTDLATLKSVVGAMCESSSVLLAYENTYLPDLANYDPKEIEKIVVAGMQYYNTHKEEFAGTLLYQNGRTGENTGWDIDWKGGIGEGQENGEGIVPAKQGGNKTLLIVGVAAVVVIAAAVIVLKNKKKEN